jgi:hypothetical protein
VPILGNAEHFLGEIVDVLIDLALEAAGTKDAAVLSGFK